MKDRTVLKPSLFEGIRLLRSIPLEDADMTKAGLALALLALPLCPAAADTPPAATKTHQAYDIIRQGSTIGTNTVDVERRGDTTQVKISTKILVKVMFIEAYRFDHDSTETWKTGQLVAFNSQTNDNGTKHSVTVTSSPDKLDINADGKHSDAPLSLRPASLWDRSFNTQTEFFDPQNGKRLAVKIKDVGDEKITVQGAPRQAHHYKISGDLERDVWFDGDTLVRLKLVGSDKSIIDSDLTQIASLPLDDAPAAAKNAAKNAGPAAKR
jgi:hypothetical protein